MLVPDYEKFLCAALSPVIALMDEHRLNSVTNDFGALVGGVKLVRKEFGGVMTYWTKTGDPCRWYSFPLRPCARCGEPTARRTDGAATCGRRHEEKRRWA